MPPLNRFQQGCIALAVSQVIASPMHAAIITVDSNLDLGDINQDPTICTLRDAIAAANLDDSPGSCVEGDDDDLIVFRLREDSETITLTSQLPTVTSSITINGDDATELTISGDNQHRIFENQGDLELVSLTLTNGSASGNGGAIRSTDYSTLSITNCVLSDNRASRGGGIANILGATMTITNSTLSENTSTSNGGGIFTYGTTTITNSTVSGNSASEGGGVYIALDSLETTAITNSTFNNNSATGNGGGISARGPVTIVSSTISANSANRGGGIFNESFAIMTNSTVSENNAISGGGGVYNFEGASIYNTIITGNAVAAGGAELQNRNEFLTVNTAYNVIGTSLLTNNMAFSNFTPGTSDIIATSNGLNLPLDNIIAPLADNGGPTLTHGLPDTSPAIDVVPSSFFCTMTDQRGEPGAINGLCDVGSFELQEDDIVPQPEIIPETNFFVIPTQNGNTVIVEL